MLLCYLFRKKNDKGSINVWKPLQSRSGAFVVVLRCRAALFLQLLILESLWGMLSKMPAVYVCHWKPMLCHWLLKEVRLLCWVPRSLCRPCLGQAQDQGPGSRPRIQAAAAATPWGRAMPSALTLQGSAFWEGQPAARQWGWGKESAKQP